MVFHDDVQQRLANARAVAPPLGSHPPQLSPQPNSHPRPTPSGFTPLPEVIDDITFPQPPGIGPIRSPPVIGPPGRWSPFPQEPQPYNPGLNASINNARMLPRGKLPLAPFGPPEFAYPCDEDYAPIALNSSPLHSKKNKPNVKRDVYESCGFSFNQLVGGSALNNSKKHTEDFIGMAEFAPILDDFSMSSFKTNKSSKRNNTFNLFGRFL